MLSLTELGISNSIVFSIYKPLAERDEKKLRCLMKLYKKIKTWKYRFNRQRNSSSCHSYSK